MSSYTKSRSVVHSVCSTGQIRNTDQQTQTAGIRKDAVVKTEPSKHLDNFLESVSRTGSVFLVALLPDTFEMHY